MVNTLNAFVCVNRTKETNTKDDIVVEMKTEVKNEETVLLKSVNGDKKDTKQQVTVVSMTSLIYSLKARRSAAFTVHCIHCLLTNVRKRRSENINTNTKLVMMSERLHVFTVSQWKH